MTTIFTNISTYSRFNLSSEISDIQIFVREYKERILRQLGNEQEDAPTPFISFAESYSEPPAEDAWLQDNYDRFFKNTPNDCLTQQSYYSDLGYITSLVFSPSGDHLIVGHSTGLLQSGRPRLLWNMDLERKIIDEFKTRIIASYNDEKCPTIRYPMFSCTKSKPADYTWVKENAKRFLDGTPNKILYNRWYLSESGFITALVYAPSGYHIIVGHSTGLVQMRHGKTGSVLATLRNVQFPPRPIFSIAYSRQEERVCYAACTDGAVYRIEIPNIDTSIQDPPEFCIRADPALDFLTTQFYSSPGVCANATPFVTQRSPALALGISAEQTKLIVGYGDTSVKIYDIETQEVDLTYKVHKLRLQFIPKKLQRVHFGQVCAICCHDQNPFMFASAAWDKTLRIWDTRCKVGCMMTFEGVDVSHNSIDLTRDLCISGSWQPFEALSVWDLAARKRQNIIRVQNRRPDVDGEYIYACQFWKSPDYNRKGKYGIIGGSGTNCVEVINLHNRYITCSYPAPGMVLAIDSYGDRIAFGGTAPVFTIVSFHDPKHEKYDVENPEEFDYTKAAVTLFERRLSAGSSDPMIGTDITRPLKSRASRLSVGRPSQIY